MSRQFFTLESLIRPLNAKDFFRDVEGVSFQHFRRVKLDSLFTWPDLNTLLNESLPRMQHPVLRFALNGQVIPQEDVSEVVRLSKRTHSFEFSRTKIQDQISKGATLIISSVENYHEGVDAFREALSHEFSERVRINAYFSPGGASGFRNHFDTHDLFIIQTEGRKRWTIGGISYPMPLESQSYLDYLPPTGGSVELILERGDVLYLPRGMWHSASADEGPSLHLAVGIYHATRFDFLEWLLDRSKSNELIRGNLEAPYFNAGANEAFSSLRSHFGQVTEQLPSLLEEFKEYRRSSSKVHSDSFKLP